MSFTSITVVGVGLIGGSLAAAARRLEPPRLVRGVDTDPATLETALRENVVDEAATPDDAFRMGWFEPGATDLVVLATPVAATREWIERLGHSAFAGVVTDVGSTKEAVVACADEHFGDQVVFVGGHPMAGSERSGVEASSPDLFEGAYYVLTPSADSDMDAYRKLHSFITALGSRVISVDAATHDEAVALISHVPHVVAAALTNLAARRSGEGQALLRLAAGGFKDMTRIAAGSADLWTGISLENDAAISLGLEDLVGLLEEYRGFLETEDADGMAEWLEEAADVRRSLPAQWVPATTALTELTVPVQDRPGMISDVTVAVSRAGCNIEDIEIDHQTEDTALLRLVLTDEGDLAGLMRALDELGFSPEAHPLEP